MILISLILNIFKLRLYEKTEVMLMNVFTDNIPKKQVKTII